MSAVLGTSSNARGRRAPGRASAAASTCAILLALGACRAGEHTADRAEPASSSPSAQGSATRGAPGAREPLPSRDGARPSRPEDALFLPERTGDFVGGALSGGPGFVERTYARGALQVTVTMTYFPMRDEDWASWVKTSADGYPQADLGLDPATSNGFYQCFGEGTARCDLLVQLRSGTHLELRGAGSKDEVTALARALPLAALAAPGATAYLGAQQH